MKTKALLASAYLVTLTSKALAKTSSANDDLELTIVVGGTLMLIAALLQGADYLKKNGRRIIRKSMIIMRRARSRWSRPSYDELAIFRFLRIYTP